MRSYWSLLICLMLIGTASAWFKPAEAAECSGNGECDDGVTCTDNICDDGTCIYPPNDTLCPDTYFCDGVDICDPAGVTGTPDAAGCVPPNDLDCDLVEDAYPCTFNWCDETNNTCVHEPQEWYCNDEGAYLWCNGSGDCDPSDPGHDADGCIVVTSAPDCSGDNDGVACTIDGACSEDPQGCYDTPSDAFCEDNNECTEPDTCHATNDCQNNPVTNGTGCTPDQADNAMCIDGTCVDNGCTSSAQCDDGKSCTSDACTGNVCVYTTDDDACADSSWCNGTETCDPDAQGSNPSTGCVSTGAPCADDGRTCTIDCDEINDACAYTEDNAACSDGFYCNGIETCDKTAPGPDGCVAGTEPECGDAFSCTADSCSEGSGTHVCVNAPNSSLCDDFDPCTTDVCDAETGCSSTPIADGGACDVMGGVDEICLNGACVPTCEDSYGCNDGYDCTNDTCDPVYSGCVYTPVNSNCDDATFCNGEEVCDPEDPGADGFGCIDGPDPTCADENACTIDTCGGSDSCEHDPADDGTVCDEIPDIPEVCNGGECVPSCQFDSDCELDGKTCTEDSCNQETHLCEQTVNSDSCTDYNLCTGVESCDPDAQGANPLTGCVAGTTPDCNDDIDCTVDGCNPSTGCTNENNNASCEDSDPCNGAETCNPTGQGADPSSGCVDGTPLTCAGDGNDCTSDDCVTNDGCTYPPLQDGTVCDVLPGVDEYCYAGECSANCVSDADCNDDLSCNGVETCDPQSGQANDVGCVAGTPTNECPDTNPCNGTEVCDPFDIDSEAVTGCAPGDTLDCDDEFSCTVDTCDPGSGCVNTNINVSCDDNLHCNGAETCDPGADGADPDTGCLPGTEVDCDDGMACSTNYCDEPSDSCKKTLDNGICADEFYCNGEEICNPDNPGHDADGCIDGPDIVCLDDDAYSCTVGSCDEDTNDCTHLPEDSRCDNGDYCDGEEFCNPGHAQANPSSGCVVGTDPCPEDTFDCTQDSCDEVEDECLHTPNHSICLNNTFCDGEEICDPENPLHDSAGCIEGGDPCEDDGVACTVETCNEDFNVCFNIPDDNLCDNNVYCDGEDYCDEEQGCQIRNIPDCGDGVDCTNDSCSEGTGTHVCVNAPDNDYCSELDNKYCNGVETCNATQGCQPGLNVVCNDNKDCTLDECDEDINDCSFTPDDGICETAGPCRTFLGCSEGECQYENLPDETECDLEPGIDEACLNGICVPGCIVDEDCADGFACTTETCDAGLCQFTYHHDTCTNAQFCDGEEICNPADAGADAAGCIAGPEHDCDDGIGCTDDNCDENTDQCLHPNSDELCDDELWCNGAETCDPDDEVNADPVTGCVPAELRCTDTFACTTDLCIEAIDECDFVKTDSHCNDQVFCNGEEICNPDDQLADADGCIAGTEPDCDDGKDCSDDSCNIELDDCVSVPHHDRCENGTFCDGVELCQPESLDSDANGCIAGTDPCDDEIFCTTDSCLEESDSCSSLRDDLKCSDGAFCNGNEQCQPGSQEADENGCIPDELDCSDNFACTVDDCDENDDQCTNTPLNSYCSDNLYCTGEETCDPEDGQAGADGCVQSAAPCDDGFDCTQDDCNENAQSCENINDDSFCSDGQFCTGEETCDPEDDEADAQGCLEASADPCDDQIVCTTDDCNEDEDSCSNTPDDTSCDDSVGCTVDECSPTEDCLNTPDDSLCDNSTYCDGEEFCEPDGEQSNGEGCIVIARDCLDEIPCTIDSCDEANKLCLHEADHSQCDDHVFCNGEDFCSVEFGCYIVARNCDDNISCTVDDCNDVDDYCSNISTDDLCIDDNPCTAPDSCEPVGCSNPPVPDDTPCDIDGNVDETCQAGVCVPECQNDIDCADAFDCTVDTCDNQGNCTYDPDDSVCNADRSFCGPVFACIPRRGCVEVEEEMDCDDGVACTADMCSDGLEACVNEADDEFCNDYNSCTKDNCHPQNDCRHTWVRDNTPCGDDYICLCGQCVSPLDEIECPTDGDYDFDPDDDSEMDLEEEESDGDQIPDGDPDEEEDLDDGETDGDRIDEETDGDPDDEDGDQNTETDEDESDGDVIDDDEDLDGDLIDGDLIDGDLVDGDEDEQIIDGDDTIDGSIDGDWDFPTDGDEDSVVPGSGGCSDCMQGATPPSAPLAAGALLVLLMVFVRRRRFSRVPVSGKNRRL